MSKRKCNISIKVHGGRTWEDICHDVQSGDINKVVIRGVEFRKPIEAEWVRTPTYWYFCSNCDTEPPEESNYRSRYCPNCGAHMANPFD